MKTINTRKYGITALVALMLPAGVALASNDLPEPPSNSAEVQARFEAADKDGDGKVTRDEAQTTMPRVVMAWEKIDIEQKGYITLEQLLIISAKNRQ